MAAATPPPDGHATRPVARSLRLVRIGRSDEYGVVQVLLGAAVVLAPVVVLAAMILAGAAFTWWFLLLAPLLVLGVARPESVGHLVLWVLLLVVWVTSVPGPFTWWSVPAALAVAVSHTALVLLGGRPTSGELAADTWTRVRSRLGTVTAVVVGVAVLAQLVRSLRTPGQVGLAAAALVAVAVWIWWGTRPPPDGV